MGRHRLATCLAAAFLLATPAARAATGGTPPVPPLAVPEVPGPTLGAGALTAQLRSRAVAFGGARGAALTYAVGGADAATVRVDLVREVDGALIARWGPSPIDPGAARTIGWPGWDGGRRVAARDGRYRFALYAGAAATDPGAAAPTLSDSFLFVSHVFPMRGPHDFGTAVNRFGAPRGERSHMGQDVLADCGMALVAARGGTVRAVGAGGDAGNYVVVHERGPGWDAAYMHLRERPLVAEGQRVYTGEVLGYVGRTGDASACHLHFELWTPPGWWSGGHAVDPLRSLRAWDRATAMALRAAG